MLLYRTFYHDASVTSLVYVSLIRPILEYACQLWSPHLVKDVEKLEKVQKFALRLCVKQWDLDYVSLLFICDLPTLAARRKYFNLCTMYKIVNQLIFFPSNMFSPRVTPFQPSSNHISAILSDKLIFILILYQFVLPLARRHITI